MASLAIMGMTSCGHAGPSDPIDAVPAGARRVTVIDLDRLAKANGAISLAGDQGLLPAAENALGMFFPADMLRPLAAILSEGGKGVDTSEAVIYTASNGYTGVILKVTDRDMLANTLLPYRDEAADFGAYDAYTTGKRLIALSDGLCVIAPDAATVKLAGDDQESDRHISRMAGIRQFLSSDNAIRSACPATEVFGKKMSGLWLCASLRFTDSSVTADMTAMQPDGRLDPIGDRIAGEIDPAAVSFVPAGSSLVIASGLQSDDAKLFGIEELVKRYFPGDVTMSRSGTTLWYARPAGTITSDNLLSPRVWNFAGVIQMPQEDGDRAVSNMQQMTGGTARLDRSTGCYTYTDGEATMTYGYVDGYFVQSANGPVAFGLSNPFTEDFTGARVCAIIDIPAESSLRQACGLPCGASLTAKVTTDNIRAKLSFYGNPTPVLSTVSSIPMLRDILPFITGTK